MINKKLCFNINNTNLYLEQVLVDYMDIPIFFICKGKSQYYIALCTDIDALNYIVVKLSLTDIYNLLHSTITMRDVILKQSEYWNIESGEAITTDVIAKKSMKSINTNLLPDSGVYFKVLTKQAQLFVQQIDSEYFAFMKGSEKV